MSKIMPHLIRNLKYHRARLGLSQLHLAERAGINRSHLADLERGAVDNVKIKTVEALAEALGVDALALMGEE